VSRGKSRRSLELIRASIEILEAIQPASVRAVCYQLFTRGLIPSMAKAETNKVGRLLTEAREEGEIPWAYIVQEGRAIERISTWDDPADFARTIQSAYRRNKWTGQPGRVIVVSEKGTVRGTLEPVLDAYEVDFLPVGGYASATRVKELAEQGDPEHPLTLLYLGDHDPSGRGMSDLDLPRRLLRYAMDEPESNREIKQGLRATDDEEVAAQLREYGIDVDRIALVDVDLTALGSRLSFPASDKGDDPRYAWFVETFGSRCWELDAMNPNALRARVTDAIQAGLDEDAWARYVAAETAERASIETTLTTWKSLSGLPS
jgi:hypothetical protein